MSVETIGVDEGTKETVRELVRMCNNLQSDVRDLESVVEDQNETIEQQRDRIDELEEERRAAEVKSNAYFTKFGRMEKVLIGEDRALGEDQFDVADDLWTQLDEVKELAENSLSVAKANTGEDGKQTKKDVAEELSRNEAVVSSVRTSQKAGAVDCGQVIDMAKPGTRLAHRTILDAWNKLCDEWGAFEIIEKKGPDGQKRKMLRCYTERLSPVLVRTVKNDLRDSEGTESLNSWLASEGVR